MKQPLAWIAFLLFPACGDDGPTAADAAVHVADAAVDAGVADADIDASPHPDAASACDEGAIVDLDDPAVGTRFDGNKVAYEGTVDGSADSTLEPGEGCFADFTGSEVVHRLTVPGRSQLRVRADTFPNLPAIVYLRTNCHSAGDASQLACYYGTDLALDDVAAGTVVDVVVDAALDAGQEPYSLTVATLPIRAMGEDCDPTQDQYVCELGLACSVAGGSPLCVAPKGGPTLTTFRARIDSTTGWGYFYAAGSDPDGDVTSALVQFFDANGDAYDFTFDSSPDTYDFARTVNLGLTPRLQPQLMGRVAIDSKVRQGIDPGYVQDLVLVSLKLVDGSGNESDTLMTDLVKDTPLVAPGGACTAATAFCAGELRCEDGLCAEPAIATSACVVADAAEAKGPGSYMVEIPASDVDRFEGSCWGFPTYGDATPFKVIVPGPASVRLTVSTDVETTVLEADTYVYIRSTCGDPESELVCDDNASTADLRSRAVTADVAPGTYYVFVDSSQAGQAGTIGVDVDMVAQKEVGEACEPSVDFCSGSTVCFDPAFGMMGICQTAADSIVAECTVAPTLTAGTPLAGTLSIGHDPSLRDASCAYFPGHPERFFLFTLDGKADLTATTDDPGTDIDTDVSIIGGCTPAAEELACNDDIEANLTSAVTAEALAPGTYAIVVELSSDSNQDASGGAPDPGHFVVTVTAKPVRAVGEACDPAGEADRCDDGLDCVGSVCTMPM